VDDNFGLETPHFRREPGKIAYIADDMAAEFPKLQSSEH
jgi:hypothetical protein